jgi:hypothetical protein
MQIQRAPQGGVPRRLPSNTPNDPTPPPPGHHDHGISGSLLHVGHDAAMVAMSLPGGHQAHAPQPFDPSTAPICGGASPAPVDPHAGHHGHHSMPAAEPQAGHAGHGGHAAHGGSNTDWLMTGSAVVSGLVAVGSAVHGAQMLGSKDRFTQLEGANHLLMSASCAAMAGAMLVPQTGLGSFTSPLMAAHGLGEVALGAYQLVKGGREDCRHDQLAGALKIAHGGCLAAAQAFPGAALPLYLGMAAVTASQIALQQAGMSH